VNSTRYTVNVREASREKIGMNKFQHEFQSKILSRSGFHSL